MGMDAQYTEKCGVKTGSFPTDMRRRTEEHLLTWPIGRPHSGQWMDKRHLGSVVLAAGLAMTASEAHAESETIFNGVRYRCTNSCVVTVGTAGNWRVTDCCGGRVKTVFQTTRPPDCNGPFDCPLD